MSQRVNDFMVFQNVKSGLRLRKRSKWQIESCSCQLTWQSFMLGADHGLEWKRNLYPKEGRYCGLGWVGLA